MYAVDLETSFVGKGGKRDNAWILQIGAADIRDTDSTLDVLVRPFEFETPQDLIDACLDETNRQQLDKTLRFWSNVLARRLNIPRGRMSIRQHAQFIAERRTHMTPLKEALRELVDFTAPGATWYAHNGKSFDFKVLRGNAKRADVSLKGIRMIDTLPLARAAWPKPHKLESLYRRYVSPEPYRAHLAKDDAVALAKLVRQLPVPRRAPRPAPRVNKPRRAAAAADALAPGRIPGLGLVGCRRLRARGIRTLAQLLACRGRPETWWKQTVPRWKSVLDYVSNK